MLSLKNIDRAEYAKSQKKKIDRELPYFVTIVTLLATSGLGPYFIFQKIREINLLPTIKTECEKILNRIDLLGIDPLSAMEQAKDHPSSKALGEFLGGYVSSMQSGGNVQNYLKSKMNMIFDRFAEKEKQSVSKVQAIVEAYMTLQIVMLAVYIMLTSIGPALNVNIPTSQSTLNPEYFLVILSPIISIAFLFAARDMGFAKIKEIEIKKILRYAVPSIGIALILIFTGMLSTIVGNGYLIGSALIALSAWPALRFKTINKASLDAESATPRILRDITEARKAGISP